MDARIRHTHSCCRVVYQDYCNAMKEVSLAIMEVIGVSLGVGRSYYRDFFADGSSIMRCNYYPPCPEPERTLGTGPHCDPSALTVLLQDGDVDGLQVLVDGEWRTVRPRPGALVVSIGDTFMVRYVFYFKVYARNKHAVRRRSRTCWNAAGRSRSRQRICLSAGIILRNRCMHVYEPWQYLHVSRSGAGAVGVQFYWLTF